MSLFRRSIIAARKQSQPIILTQWKIVGNSEVKTLPYPDGVVLPTGYKRCEYLESDGTAYIELPFGFTKTDELYLKGAFDSTELTTAIKCLVAPKTWNDDTNRFGFGLRSISGQSALVCCMYYGSGSKSLSPYIDASTDVCEWEYKNYTCTIGSSSAVFSDLIFGSETANLRLFYGYNSATKCKICEYRHKKGNTEYRLIPCLDSNDTPCMYDVINNQAYYNSAGSGTLSYKLYPQPQEIWSCGEYSAVDGKYHILVQPLGGSIADIALTEPLRKDNDVADTIEFPSTTEGKALVTRNLRKVDWVNVSCNKLGTTTIYFSLSLSDIKIGTLNLLSANYPTYPSTTATSNFNGLGIGSHGAYSMIRVVNSDMNELTAEEFKVANANEEIIYELATPTTELVDAPQIEEADSYSMVISQGAKAVEWSSFTTNSE